MKRIFKLFVTIIIIFLFLTYGSVSFASKKSELTNEKDKINEEINDKKEDLQNVKEEKSETLSQVEDLIGKISDYQSEISDLNNKISDLKKKISEAEENIKQDTEAYEQQQKDLDARLVAMYKTGETSYLDFLLSSSSLADFISSYYLISQVAEYDTKMLNQLDEHKQKIEKDKAKLEANKNELDKSKATVESKQQALKVAKTTKEKYVKKLSAEEKEIQKELEQFEKDKREIEAQLKKIAAEEAKKGTTNLSSTPSACGYISPIRGTSKGNITCGFYGYSGHGGVDFAGHYGEAVVAVKAGTVVTSKAIAGSIKNYNSSGTYLGSYSSYGEYIIINHHDGTMTLYAHGLAGSRVVKAGDEVKQGQTIMKVGNTGNVYSGGRRPSKSQPLIGAHLHFEVRVGGSRVNPTPYLP